MQTKIIAFVVLALACVGAAAGGAYLAVRHQLRDAPAEESPARQVEPPALADSVSAFSGEPWEPKPEATADESRAIARSTVEDPQPEAGPDREAVEVRVAPPARRPEPEPRASAPAPAPEPSAPESTPAVVLDSTTVAVPSVVPSRSLPDPVVAEAPLSPEPVLVELVVQAGSVLGLQLETSISTETAQIEDLVRARVTRDVLAGGDVAIPAGTLAEGSVTLVEPGGKVRERARLGIRFHTLVFDDGTEVPLDSETVFRDGESPAGTSAARIGGAAVGGAVLGAILGGNRGAAIGSAVGAAGGTAAVMAGDRNPAVIRAGSTITVRLLDSVSLLIEEDGSDR